MEQVWIPSVDGTTALHHAVIYGHISVARLLLLENNACPDVADNIMKCTPLFYAVKDNDSKIVEQLLDANVKVQARNAFGMSSLHIAAKMGKQTLFPILLKCSNPTNDVNAKDKRGFTPLHFCALGNHRATAEVLLDNGADKNSQDFDGCTPLIIAAEKAI
ncbi:hypothetical protein CEXT_194261 [Caerostris extrusa]|uniref:Alpha-latrotoxin n=1 Tax=Caerostris extrusa TaxID=172846 RepID=A0AAV4MMA6_CAEEX|nr:hypothetical protein CEXT_194261 [Caerostris extrusa]